MSFGGAPKPKPPPVQAVLPTPDDGNQAAESELQALARRKGFASTLLTSGGAQGLGGAVYCTTRG
jgi:hypothetical protein